MKMAAGAHNSDIMSSSELLIPDSVQKIFHWFISIFLNFLIFVHFYYTNDNFINTKDTLFVKYDGFKSLITNVMCIVYNWDNGNENAKCQGVLLKPQ